MITEYINAREKKIYSRSEWDALGNDGQYKIGYSDGYAICQEHGINGIKYLDRIVPINNYERGKRQAALDWLVDQKIKAGCSRCHDCGRIGDDIHPHIVWIGGQGYVRVLECDNIVECCQRIDAKRG